ncbi:MAG: hypothetical protein V2I79_08830 [Xanthomonadales bacterium]|jgi:hypothetical protein|nr:hypothetical protein [Xanthomonadales bacterium]
MARGFARNLPFGVLSGFEKAMGSNTLKSLMIEDRFMKANQDLIGKTITAAVAVKAPGEGRREIYMLQFSDGTHVEFVSPQAKRQFRRHFRRGKRPEAKADNDLQLALNVA